MADGTPDELTAALAGRTLVVQAAQPRRAQQVLLAVPGVLSVAQVGNALRVLTAGDHEAAGRLRATLEKAGLPAEVAAVPPNLEDVFVAATRGNDAKARAA